MRESFAHLTLRKLANLDLLLTRDVILNDGGELYILDEVYGIYIYIFELNRLDFWDNRL